MKNKILRDEVVNVLLTDSSLRDYVSYIIALSTGLDYDFVIKNLELDSNRVNNNVSTKYSYVDAMYKNDYIYVNIEVNTKNTLATDKKNFRYLCNMVLKQVPPGSKDNFNKVYQININDFDVFGENKFLYRSSLIEENLHLKRNDFVNVIDINLEFLRKVDYNIIERKETISLERLLYIMICDDEKKRAKLYSKDKIMDKVNNKVEDLNSDFNDLYYDREEYHNEVIYEVGVQDGIAKGIQEKSLEVAKNMLLKNLNISLISDITGLKKEDIIKLKEK